MRILFAMILLAVCGALAEGDTLVVDFEGESISMPEPKPEPLPALEPFVASPEPIIYTGAALSAFIPGGGQFFRGRYVLGGVFLVSEVTAFGLFGSSWSNYRWLDGEVGRLRDSVAVVGDRGALSGDSTTLYWAGHYSVWADRYEYEARQSKFAAYNALAWGIGIHIFSFMNALELDGFKPSGAEKDPTKAGILAAVPFLGLGQLYNERPGKAGMMMMAQTSLAVTALGYHRQMGFAADKYNRMRDTSSVQYNYRAEHLEYWQWRHDRSFSQRNTFLWISLFTYLYSIFDAVVDAHLSDYEEKIRVTPDLAVGVGGLRPGLALIVKF